MTEGYRALRSGVAWLDLSSRGRLEARGRDRARFLHNITSNEVKRMSPGASCYAFLLTPQGHIQADLEIYCYADRFLIDTEPEVREKALRHILKYKVADQIEIEDVTATSAAIGLEGPGVRTIDFTAEGYTIAPFTVTGQPGYQIYCPVEARHGIVETLEAGGARPATPEDARIVRIENGKPRYGEDILESTLPQETRQMHGVSFNKGCYIGQEIVERIRARGHVNRELTGFQLDTAEPVAPGTRVTVDGREIQVTSSAFSPHFGKVVAIGYARAMPAAASEAG
jgi:folate-binding protein YgfZ